MTFAEKYVYPWLIPTAYRLARLITRRQPPTYRGWQDFEVGTYVTDPAPVERKPALAFPADRALLIRDVPNFAGIGAQLVIPAGDTGGEWKPLPIAPGLPEHEYQRDGNKILVRRMLPDFPHIELHEWTP